MELLTAEPLKDGMSNGGWVFAVARDPAAREPLQMPQQAVAKANRFLDRFA